MHKATQGTHWLLSPSGQMEGISCGSDAATEHECGIDRLKQALGCKTTFEKGLPDRCIQKHPPAMAFYEHPADAGGTPQAWLIMGGRTHVSMTQASNLPPGLRFPLMGKDEFLGAAWDDEGVLICASGHKNVERLNLLFKAVQEKDLAMGGAFTGKTGWHPQACGLVFVKASAIPAELAEKALAEDESNMRLTKAAAELGLEDELRKAGLGWYALVPRWADKTEKEIVFWLNPMKQQDHHYGLYTVDVLRQWAQGKGPIMMDKPLMAVQKKMGPALESLRYAIFKAGMACPTIDIAWGDDERTTAVARISYREPEQTAGTKEDRIPEGTFPLSFIQELKDNLVTRAGATKKKRNQGP